MKGDEDRDVDFKADQKFSEHIKNQAVVSEFARKKTLTQQRQYLPVFAVREEVCISVCVCVCVYEGVTVGWWGGGGVTHPEPGRGLRVREEKNADSAETVPASVRCEGRGLYLCAWLGGGGGVTHPEPSHGQKS